MQYYKIRLKQGYNLNFSGGNTTTVVGNSPPSFSSGYYSHNNGELGGNLVSEYNVRSFLNDNKNQNIINEFISFLTGSTTENELVYILGNDSLLASEFNSFYSKITTPSQPISNSGISYIHSVSFFENLHNWDGFIATPEFPSSINSSSRIQDIQTGVTTILLSNSYYININLNSSHEETDRMTFKLCNDTQVVDTATTNDQQFDQNEMNISNQLRQNDSIINTGNIDYFIKNRYNKMRMVGKRSI